MTPFKTLATCVAVTLGVATAGEAASLKLDVGFDVTRGAVAPNTFPSDPGGLDGARFTISSVFADGATFQRQSVSADSTQVTIILTPNPTTAQLAGGNRSHGSSQRAAFCGQRAGL